MVEDVRDDRPARLLQRLLDYIEEQAKEIDPRQFCLGNAKGFIRRSQEIAGLPGVGRSPTSSVTISPPDGVRQFQAAIEAIQLAARGV